MEWPGWEGDVFRQAWVEMQSMTTVTRGEVNGYGARRYHPEKAIFPVASHHGVLQQHKEAQISKGLAHPGYSPFAAGKRTQRSHTSARGMASPRRPAQRGW